MRNSHRTRVWFASLLLISGLARAQASAQAPKPFEFEVFSIHPHKPGTDPLEQQYRPDGLTLTVSLEWVIELAYSPLPRLPPHSVKVVHAPGWIDDWYDIDARVAPEDMAAWQKAGPSFGDSEPLRSALRVALKERCKLALHIAPVEIPYWNIVVGKHGATLKETVPGAIKPVPGHTSLAGKGFYISDNGKNRFVGVSMDDLALVLMRSSREVPVQNETGLPGRYDFILPSYPASEISDPLDRFPIDSIGLILERGKGPGLILDIDHIERPDPN
jgi:uncharacterized protein (TIGR03435 family)